MRAIILAFSVFLSGCAVLGDRRVAAGCQAADGITTYIALKKGAVEANPLLSGMSPGAILVLKLAVAYWIWTHFDRPTTDGEKVALTAVSAVGCIPAVSNIGVIRSLL